MNTINKVLFVSVAGLFLASAMAAVAGDFWSAIGIAATGFAVSTAL